MDTESSAQESADTRLFNPVNLLNVALFQLTWFGSVMGAARGTALFGLIGLSLLLAFSTWRKTLRADVLFVCALLPLGWVVDSIWANAGILNYGTTFAPLWILMLWAGVGLSLNHGMSFFVARPLVGGLLAGGAAPFSYLGGERLGAVEIPDPVALAWISLGWFVVFFTVFRLARRAQQNRLARLS